jgi:hypothetical protein
MAMQLNDGPMSLVFGDSVFNRMGAKDDLPRLWEHNGVIFCDGLFRLHDERGFSLTDSLLECKRRGFRPCLMAFQLEAARAGWTREKADKVIADAKADAGWEDAS